MGAGLTNYLRDNALVIDSLMRKIRAELSFSSISIIAVQKTSEALNGNDLIGDGRQ